MYNINPQLAQAFMISQEQKKNERKGSTGNQDPLAMLVDNSTRVKWNLTDLLKRLRRQRPASIRNNPSCSEAWVVER